MTHHTASLDNDTQTITDDTTVVVTGHRKIEAGAMRSSSAVRTCRRLVAVLSLVAGLSAGVEAMAQVPPHQPGSVCFTQSFWCAAQPPGPPNTPCTCWTPYGPVAGVRG